MFVFYFFVFLIFTRTHMYPPIFFAWQMYQEPLSIYWKNIHTRKQVMSLAILSIDGLPPPNDNYRRWDIELQSPEDNHKQGEIESISHFPFGLSIFFQSASDTYWRFIWAHHNFISHLLFCNIFYLNGLQKLLDAMSWLWFFVYRDTVYW